MSVATETDPPTVPAGIFAGYGAAAPGYDEMRDASGTPRPHWQRVVHSLERMGVAEVRNRAEQARRIIREHGVTYNIYADAQGAERPWELDIVPLIIPPAEWARLEAALIQRATLFNRILGDLYGPQTLLHERRLPPPLVYANYGFLRPLRGVPVPGGVRLFLHAVDLARSPDGQWWALADRTQAPSGVGYALENRIVLSRILPDEFRDCRVLRLALFFQQLRDTLRKLSPRNRESPNIVLLTPGEFNETYFEQAYLSRYLGFSLVEGNDLTVRDRKVFIKTLEGLQQVDVILRRVDDSYCDPLELRAESLLGVAGLVEAVRSGNVTVANSLGSGLVETPALMAFLPGLCQHLLGEQLKLPSVATWWCGQRPEFNYVREHLGEVVLKRAFASMQGEPVFGEKLTDYKRGTLLEEMARVPYQFVGQEQVELSRAPAWADHGTVPRPLVLRAFVAATGDGYTVMPGGLTRISQSAENPIVSMQRGGGSKDTWVLTDGPVNTFSLLRPPPRAIRRELTAAEVPSRVADDLFWLGRYAERLEGTLRLLRCAVRQLSGETSAEQTPERSVLVKILVGVGLLPADVPATAALEEVEKDILYLIYKANRPGSIPGVISSIRQALTGVRDRLSVDTWRILARLQTHARTRPHRNPVADALDLIDTLIVDLAAFSGMEMENMTRGHGWRFLDFGRRLERALHIAGLLESGLSADSNSPAMLESLLEVADSSITYRRRHLAQVQLHGVLQLLLKDETNPRALAFQLCALREHSKNLPAAPLAGSGEMEGAQVMRLLERIRHLDVMEMAEAQQRGDAAGFQKLVLDIKAGLAGLSDTLTHHYFSHVAPQVS